MDEPGKTSTTPKYEFQYDARGIASLIKDNVLMTETRVTSDLADRPSESVTRDANGNLVHKSVLNYDGKNRVKEFIDVLPEATHKTAYTYDADNRVTEVKYDDSDTHKVNLTYDLLNRVTNKTVTNGVPYSTNYTYVAGDTATYGAGATTPLIETITQGSGANAMNFAYAYDSRGNIVSETRNGVTVSYEYDELGQLIRVNDPNDPAADSVHGTTWIITYDRGGNILQKLAYVLSSDAHPSELRQSLIYEYTDANWKDKLTLFCNDELEYDAIGNLTDDGQWTYTWEKGRQLKSMHNASTGVTMEFKYNAEGIRTQKVKKVNGTVTETTDYILKGKQIAAMKKNTDTYYFTYDASGKPATVNFNGANYTYVKNLQGDIVGILDVSGNMVVEYMYDAWGDAVSIYSASTTVDALAFDNPFRYRGYVFDEETTLYYLQNRYYSSGLYRFLCVDVKLGARSSYTYCANSPVIMSDWNGNEEQRSDNYSSAYSYNAIPLYHLLSPIRYNTKTQRYEKTEVFKFYISHEDIYPYVGSLYLESDDPFIALQEEIVEESTTESINTFFENIGDLGPIFNTIFSCLNFIGKLKEIEENKKKKQMKKQLKTESEKAIMNKTGLYITIEKTYSWAFDDIFIVTHYKPDLVETTIKYQAEK